MYKKVPPGETFQRMNRPNYTVYERVPMRVEQTPELNQDKRQWKINPREGGIADIPALATQQLGRTVTVAPPGVVFEDITTAVNLWGGVAADPLGGNPQTFQPPANSTFGTILLAHGENTSNPEALLVNLDAPFFPTSTDRSVDLKAELTWGNGDDLSRALVDIRTGTQLSLVGTNFQMRAIYTALTGAPGGFPEIRVGGAFGYGRRSGQNRAPTFTQRAFNVAPGTRTVAVPNYATDVVVYTVDQTTGLSVQVSFDLLDAPGGQQLAHLVQAANVFTPIPLPSITRNITLTNGGMNNVNFTLVYGLAL